MGAPSVELSAGTFWPEVEARSRHARDSGRLQSIDTTAEIVHDHGVGFIVRVAANLRRKHDTPSTYRPGKGGENPFRPPDPSLTVGRLGPAHLAVLNKFNVLARHVLVVTREFHHQESPLTEADFQAVATGLAGRPALSFYNSGRVAGASQAHRHFQIVPLPLCTDLELPVDGLLADAENGVNTVSGFRFRHYFVRLNSALATPERFAANCRLWYRRALESLGVTAQSSAATARLPPYNLLLTRRWLLVVPRRMESWRRISVNGLGYAGSLFVSSEEELRQVRSTGPMSVLESVSMPWN